LIKEAEATAGEIEDKSVLDAANVASAQAVEHHEIAHYGALIAWRKGRQHQSQHGWAAERRKPQGRELRGLAKSPASRGALIFSLGNCSMMPEQSQ
jgi:hypothetical protein